MFFNQTLNYKKELGSYSVDKITFFGVGLDFALEPVYPFLSAVLSEPVIHGSYDLRITNIRDPSDPTDLKDPTPDLRIRARSRSRIIKLFSVGAGL